MTRSLYYKSEYLYGGLLIWNILQEKNKKVLKSVIKYDSTDSDEESEKEWLPSRARTDLQVQEPEKRQLK